MRKKAIPPPTARNVIPPNLDRDYFDEAVANPFRPQAQAFEPVNAWWLAEAALLANADEGFARRQFERAGLGEVAFVSGAGSQCYLAESRDFVIAAFRGTQVPKPGVTTDPFGASRRRSGTSWPMWTSDWSSPGRVDSFMPVSWEPSIRSGATSSPGSWSTRAPVVPSG